MLLFSKELNISSTHFVIKGFKQKVWEETKSIYKKCYDYTTKTKQKHFPLLTFPVKPQTFTKYKEETSTTLL